MLAVAPVASVNPVTALLDASRSLMAGDPTGVIAAYSVAFGMIAVFAVWAMTGMRRAETAG